MKYKVVKASSAKEAIEKSGIFVGQAAKVTSVNAVANSDGTYTILTEFETTERAPAKA